jgi:transposase-like protein
MKRRNRACQALSIETIEQIKALSRPDRNQADIAREIGVAPGTVGKWQRKLGLPRPLRGEQHPQ